MTANSRWALLLALAGGVAVGAAFTMRRRGQHRHAEKRQDKRDLRTWEGEGGSLAMPATAQLRA